MMYLSYFKLKFKIGLQYRASAIAGIIVQIFFGLVNVFTYSAFYESGSSNLPISYNNLISYLWLCQAFFAIINLWYKDNDILYLIRSGNVSYELCRPQDLYFIWFSKILGERLSKVTLCFIPVILFGLLMPSPYNLNLSITLDRFIIFIISFILSIILMTCLINLYHILCLFTIDDKGIINIFMVISDILSGLVVPIPFFPSFMITISNILPFRYISDFPLRLYVGDISLISGCIGIIIELIWIVILFVVGKLLVNKALKNIIVQGG